MQAYNPRCWEGWDRRIACLRPTRAPEWVGHYKAASFFLLNVSPWWNFGFSFPLQTFLHQGINHGDNSYSSLSSSSQNSFTLFPSSIVPELREVNPTSDKGSWRTLWDKHSWVSSLYVGSDGETRLPDLGFQWP